MFGSAPNVVEAPENSLDSEITWAWTSRPRMISHLPVRPSIRFFSSSLMTQYPAGLAVKLALLSIDAADAEHGLLVERAADQLQPERQALAVEAARHRDAGQAGQVHRSR